MPERFVWVAVYKNGDLCFQCDEHGEIKHKFSEIDQKNLDLFLVFDRFTSRKITLKFSERMKLIFYWDRYITLQQGNEERSTVACFGWQDKETGSKTIIRMHENGQIEVGDE